MTSNAVEYGARPAAPPVAVEEETATIARRAKLEERITP
jgi:hypothetical protein